MSAAEGVLKLFQNYSGDNEHVGKYSRAAVSARNNFGQVSARRNEIISDGRQVDEGRNNFEITLSHM